MSVISDRCTTEPMSDASDSELVSVGVLQLDGNECVGAEAFSAILADRVSPCTACYPDSSRLEATIARRSGVDPSRIVATAGADDAIDRIMGACLTPGSSVLLADPTFTMFQAFARNRKAETRSVPWMKGPFPTADFVDASSGCSLMAVVSPNNPTGMSIPVESLMALRSAAPDPMLLIDLAYVEFGCEADGTTVDEVMESLRWMPKTVLVRTLSKAWGLAGLRVGWTESTRDFAERIRTAGGPFPIASSSIQTARAVLEDESSDRQVDDRVRRVTRNRRETAVLLERFGCDAGESRANFLLVSDPRRSGRSEWLADGLSGLDVEVRRFQEPSLAERVRITIPVGEVENRRLRRSLSTVLDPAAILFDLDGVLADVSESYRMAIIQTAAAFGVQVTNREIDRIKAEGDANDDWRLTWRILGDAGVDITIEEVIDRFQRLYLGSETRAGLREREVCFVDVDRLSEATRGRSVGVVTGRPGAEARWFLERSGLDRVVGVLIAREDAALKPEPDGLIKALDALDSNDAWFFGDTVDDITAARRVPAGRVLPIGMEVAPGSGVRTTLIQAGAARVLSTGPDMIELLEGMLR